MDTIMFCGPKTCAASSKAIVYGAYVTGEIQAPVCSKDEEDTKFADRLEDWDCKNHQIISWFRHSIVPSIHQQFGRYENDKDVWDLLSHHYTTAGLSHEYQLWGLLVNMKQALRQPINEFLFYMQSIWDQMEQSTHIVKDLTDAAILATKRDHPSPYSGICYESAFSLMRPVFALFNPITLMQSLLRLHVFQALPSSRNGQSGILPRSVNHSVAAAVAEDSHSDPFLLSVPVSNTWYFDSACCNHMSPDSQLFSSVIPTTHAPLIQTVNGSHITASHTDPRMNQVLGTGRRVGWMFELTSLHLPSTLTPPPSHVAHIASVFPLSLWHLRLDPSTTLPIPPADSLISPLALLPDVDPVLAQTSDLLLAAPPADSPVPPQELAQLVDPVTDQTPPPPFQAMTEELQALEKIHTWDLVDLPRGKSAIGCKWVYKIKTKSDGTIERYKARLVAKGYAQEYGTDYEETFAPVARITSVRSLLTIAAIHQWPLFQMDVKNAFLNGDFTEEVYMQEPPAILCISLASPPVFMIQHCLSADLIRQFLHQQFEMKDLGRLGYFLGLEISSDSTGYYLSQAKYASDLLSRAGLTDTKVVSTALEMNARLTPLDGTPLSDATLYLIHILRYIKGMFHGLHFSAHSTLDLCAYSDADWVGDSIDYRSTNGFCFFLGDSISYFLAQYIVSCSSTKAEYRALVDTTSELLALRWLLEDMGLTHSSPIVIHCDNRSAIQIAHNDVFHERTKHIEIDCHPVRYHLSVGILRLLLVSSSNQTTDIFTKTFPPGRFRDLVSKLKMASVRPP
uniref:Reverse transcriptase Ty1/copia-type domain-containing protein n=1 Tax=Fagus sylvatica TaxID=28930 RepID=A0A2N9FH94_FAGSY